MTQPGIEFRGVAKRYDDSPGAPWAVDRISFAVPQGTLTTILGPSGCGKTTTLRMIAGLETPSAGQIFIAGKDVTALSPSERNVSMVFQSYALFPHMNVLANVAYGLDVSGVAKGEARRRAQATLASVGLTGFDARRCDFRKHAALFGRPLIELQIAFHQTEPAALCQNPHGIRKPNFAFSAVEDVALGLRSGSRCHQTDSRNRYPRWD